MCRQAWELRLVSGLLTLHNGEPVIGCERLASQLRYGGVLYDDGQLDTWDVLAMPIRTPINTDTTISTPELSPLVVPGLVSCQVDSVVN